MALTTYTTEIEATVSYRVDHAQHMDEDQTPSVEDTEVHDLWMFGREWTMPELVETFGKKGADAMERFIIKNAEYV